MDPIVEYWVFLFVGALCLRQVRRFGPTQKLTELHPSLERFVGCDLCLGSWFLMGLSLVWGLRIGFTGSSLWILQAVDVFLTGIVSAYTLHIVKLGVREFVLWGDDLEEDDAEISE